MKSLYDQTLTFVLAHAPSAPPADREPLLRAMALADAKLSSRDPSEGLLMVVERLLMEASDRALSWPDAMTLLRSELRAMSKTSEENLRDALRRAPTSWRPKVNGA